MHEVQHVAVRTQVNQLQDGFFKDDRKTGRELKVGFAFRLHRLSVGQFGRAGALTRPYRLLV